ncbi:hypothetical protein Tco_0964493 [Tanacetum coccineum]
MGLWYSKDSGYELIAYSDADLAGCNDDCKSTSGGIKFLGDKLVGWSSKKQDCTAMSIAKAEYVSLYACYALVIWMRTQLLDYGFRYTKIPIYCDSQSAIAISCNLVQHSRTKHINIRYRFIKEHVEKSTIELYFVGTKYQLADLFTKALPKERFEYLVHRIGMRCLTLTELGRLAKLSSSIKDHTSKQIVILDERSLNLLEVSLDEFLEDDLTIIAVSFPLLSKPGAQNPRIPHQKCAGLPLDLRNSVSIIGYPR